jgi:hypothetical protein
MLPDTIYVSTYIRQITTQQVVETPDPNQLNGYQEIVETLNAMHKQGGPEVALEAWRRT